MKKISIFEPPLSNATGGCGVIVNPELLRITGIISALRNKGIEAERYNYVIDFKKFEENSIVKDFIEKNGVEKLPLVLVDDKIIKAGGYPTKEEIAEWLDITEDI